MPGNGISMLSVFLFFCISKLSSLCYMLPGFVTFNSKHGISAFSISSLWGYFPFCAFWSCLWKGYGRLLHLLQFKNDETIIWIDSPYFVLQLHHVGAPGSKSIAPVTYMWRPIEKKDIGIGAEHDVDSVNSTQTYECCSSFRQLWVWMHASAFNEGYDALKFACQKLVNCRDYLSLIYFFPFWRL